MPYHYANVAQMARLRVVLVSVVPVLSLADIFVVNGVFVNRDIPNRKGVLGLTWSQL